MNKKLLVVIILILGIAVFVEMLQFKVYPQSNLTVHRTFTEDSYYDTYEKACYAFVKNKLSSTSGGVFTNYMNSESTADYAKGHEVLSESQGLYMLYLLQKNDKQDFDKTLEFIKKHILKEDGTILWRTHENTVDIATGNAVVDDLRIVRALLGASKKWHDKKYQETLNTIENKLYKLNTKDDNLYDYYDYKYHNISSQIPLCYYDLKTIQMLSEYRKEWSDIGLRSLEVIQKGYLGNKFPFYKMGYNYDTGKYKETDTIQMTESILTVLHLAEVGMHEEKTIIWIKEQLKKGAIYGAYDTKGIAMNNIESTSIYATIAQIGKITGDVELYTLAIEHMLRFQVTDVKSSVKGAFGNEQTEEAYSYDNLQALLAF